jgi:crossover junction endodeoxyribonuclease RuvC
MKILSIDPGFERMGIAVLERGIDGKDTVIESDCIRTNTKDEFPIRLRVLGDTVNEWLHKHQPEALAIESLYFGSNQTTGLKVAEVRGVIAYLATCATIPIYEIHPTQVKSAVTGNGHADKTAVQRMTRMLVQLDDRKRLDDEIDAIAIGIAGLSHAKSSYPQSHA